MINNRSTNNTRQLYNGHANAEYALAKSPATFLKIEGKGSIRMNLIITILCAVFFQARAAEATPSITISKQNASLSTVFTEIKKQTNYLFLYNKEWVTMANKIDIDVKNAPLDKVLSICFAGQPLTYSIVDKTIVLHLKKQPPALEVVKPAPPVRVSGKVKDEKGDPIQGVSVMVKGSKTGTQTGADGGFSIQMPDGNSTLVFTFIGYKTQEVVVGGQTSITVTMADSFGQLNDVLVSGYTSQRRADFTGSASQINSKDIANRPVPSFDQALAGQAPGVKMTSGGGSLNTPPVFRIRGTNSINLSSYPLIIIDGVTYFTGDIGNTAENNPLSTLNTEDIESIDVLKDASATAIYGSRAANGVVVISTKKGKQGKPKVNYSGWVGINTKPKLPELLGVSDYMMIKNESLANIGSAPAYFPQVLADGSTVNTNWYDYVYQSGKQQSHNLSVSGANATTNYFVSVGYTDQEGFLVKNTFDRRVARANLEHKLTKNITIGTNLSMGNTMNSNLTGGVGNSFGLNNLVRESMVLPPNLSPFNPDGSYNVNGSGIGYGANTVLTGYYNPLPQLEHDKFTSESNSLVGLVFGEWEFVKGLKAKVNYSINNLSTTNRSFSNPYQAGGFATNGSATNTQSRNYRTAITNTLNYTGTIAKDHHINALIGYEEIHTTSQSFGVTRTNLTDRYYESFEGSFTTVSGSSSAYGENGLRSYLSSLFYDYKRKYLLTASYRQDGFSGLSVGNKYGGFGAGSIGWNIHEEEFYKNSSLAKTISALKIKGSYGQVGNVNIGNYPSLSLYASGVYGGVASLAISQTGNPDLKWETSKKTDIGLSLGLWSNKVTIDADYYNNNIDGLVLAAPQSPSKGIPGNSITANVGSMYNRGLELNVQAHILDKGAFKWTTGFNLSTLKNKVTALATGNADLWTSGLETTNITRVGYSVASVYVIPTTGVNPANGLRVYLNKNDREVQYNPVGSKWTYLDGTDAPALDLYADSRMYGPSLPTYYGGFNNTFTYKGLDLYVNIVYSGGNKIYNGTRATLLDNRFFNNQVDILRRWTTPGQVTDIPRLHYNDQYASGSVLMNSANVENGGYIKLGNASLGYTIPAKVLGKTGISSIRIYGSASNIIIHTKYTGSDPEISANGDSNVAFGRDKNSVPAGKTFTLGLNVGF